jgi:hypothetical protein
MPEEMRRKTQSAEANADRVRTLVRSDRRLGLRLIAEEGYGNLIGGKPPNCDLAI